MITFSEFYNTGNRRNNGHKSRLNHIV